MKLAIDGRGINLYRGTGIGTYTDNLVKELFNLDKENQYSLFWNGNGYDEFKKDNSSIILSPRKHGGFYESVYVPTYLDRHCIDLYHIPQNGIGLTPDFKTPTVVTIHDLIPYTMPETVGRGYLERFLKDMPTIINNSAGILTVSEFSKNDILKFFPYYSPDRIHVTPLAANENFIPVDKNFCKEFMLNTYNLDNDYLLYIGGFSSRKNVRELIISFSKIINSLKEKVTLVLVGPIKEEGKKLVQLVEDLNLNDYVLFTGYVDEVDLPTLYSGALSFVYPSLYEGFGLPPLEAMSCKTAVITSNLTSIPEVTSDCALLINPFNTDELSAALYNIITDSYLRDNLANRGYERSLQFTWKLTASKTLDFYNFVLNNPLS